MGFFVCGMMGRLKEMIKYVIQIFFTGFFFFPGCSSSLPDIQIKDQVSPKEKLTTIDLWLNDLSNQKQFNGAILVANDGKVDLINTYGFSDLARKNSLTIQSSFRLASVSKQFTAMAIMILKEQGKIQFDDPVQKYLNNFPYSDVTIRHLLTHTSGLPDYESLVLKFKKKYSTMYFFITGQSRENITYKGEPNQYKDSHDILSMKDVLDLVTQYQDKRKFMAGEKFKYSNTGYVLLAHLVEQVSGQTFESFMDQEIFEPLNMSNSSVWNLNTAPGKLMDRVEGTNKSQLNDYTWLDGIAGDGAVFLSIEDFINWDRSLANHTLVSDSTFHEAITPFITTRGDTSYYGFGWGLSKKGANMDHSGGWVGALTYIYRNPDTGVLFVLLDSSTNRNMREIMETIGNLFAGDIWEDAKKSK